MNWNDGLTYALVFGIIFLGGLLIVLLVRLVFDIRERIKQKDLDDLRLKCKELKADKDAAVQNIKPINPHGELREMLIDEMIDKGKWQDEQRGRWIYAKCNLCGKVQDVRSNYCPNCGAKMDGEQ